MKKLMVFVIVVGMCMPVAFGQFSESTRQAFIELEKDVVVSLKAAGLAADKPVAVIPLAGDKGGYVFGALQNALTQAGLKAVPARDQKFWDEIFAQVAWAERKSDILDKETLTKFGSQLGAQLVVYGTVRDAYETRSSVYVEVELHMSSMETAARVWGGLFSKRYTVPGVVGGQTQIDARIRDVLHGSMKQGSASITASGKLPEGATVAVIPIADDPDGYVKGLVLEMLAGTKVRPVEMDVRTLAEARRILRDQPAKATAILYGSVRDLSRQFSENVVATDRNTPGKVIYRIRTEVQLHIQSVSDGVILWSQTLVGEGADELLTPPPPTISEEVLAWLAGHSKLLLYVAGGVFGLVVLAWLVKSVTRVR